MLESIINCKLVSRVEIKIFLAALNQKYSESTQALFAVMQPQLPSMGLQITNLMLNAMVL